MCENIYGHISQHSFLIDNISMHCEDNGKKLSDCAIKNLKSKIFGSEIFGNDPII